MIGLPSGLWFNIFNSATPLQDQDLLADIV